MSTTPLKKDNTFLYDSVNLFEQGDRALTHNQFGAHIYTAELDSLFGAKRGEALPDNPNLNTAFYEDPETGKKASEYVIDKIWDNNAGNEIGFASQYTGLADNHPTVINYAGEIRRRKIEKDKENAKQRALNSIDIEKNKSELLEEFPDDEAKINKAIKNGRTPLQEFKSQLKNKLSANANKSPAQKQIERDTSLEIGLETLTNSLLGMGKWAVENLDIPNVNYAQRQEIGRRVGGVRKEIAEDVELDREFLQALDPNYGKDFEVSDMLDPTFWRTKMAEQLPNLALLYATGGGIAKIAGGGFKGAVKGALGSRPIEAGMEAVGLHDELLAKGVDEETAGIEASKLYAKNVGLVGADAIQLFLMFSKVPKPFRDTFTSYIKKIRNIGAGAISEGYEEVLQGFWTDQGKASALGELPPDKYDYFKLATPEQREQFAIGALFGGGMTAIGQTISPDQVNNIIEEEKERAINLQQAKELEDIAPVTVEQELFQERVNSLSKHGDKIDIGFVDSEVTQVFTEDEIRGLNYNNLEEFQPAKLKEGDDGYVNDGTDRYELAIPATNYETGDSDAQRVLLSRSATTADFLEDTAEAVLRRLQTTNSQLADDIFGWIASVEDVASQLDVQLPYSGEELFSKSFVYNSLGYADKGALPDFTVMPDALQDAFVQELETNDGGNLLDSMAILGQQAEPTQAIEDFEPIQGQESQEGFAFASTQEVLDRLRSNKPIIQKGETIKPETFKRLANRIVRRGIADIAKFSEQDPDVVTKPRSWYRQDIEDTISIAEQELPDIRENETYFKTLLGILSNGQPVAINYNQAMEVYSRTEDNKLPFVPYTDEKGRTFQAFGGLSETGKPFGGVRANTVTAQGQKLRRLVDKFGTGKKLTDFMLTKFTGKELIEQYGMAKGTPKNEEYFGAHVFGKKIGAYIVNMHGIHEEAVLDTWMARMFDRYTGSITPDFSRQKLRVMNNAISRIADKLTKTTGMDWGVDQVQAVLWYIEKETYIQAGVKPERGESYKDVAKRRQEALGGFVSATPRNTKDVSTDESQGDVRQESNEQSQRSGADRVQEGFSLKAKEKSTAQYFNQKVSRKTKRKIKRSERDLKPKQFRDYYRTWSSQMRRISDSIMNSFTRFQKRELDIKRQYLNQSEQFIRVLKQAYTRAYRLRNTKLKELFMDLNLALNNSNEELVINILTNEEFFKKRNALNKYNQFRKAHEQLHKTAFKAGLRLNYIETHFPRWMTEYDAYILETFETLPKDQKSKLQGVLDRATEEKGEALTKEEKATIANRYVKDLKGVTNRSNNYELKSRKIEKLTYDQLKYYAKPHEAMGAYINSMAGLIAQSEFMGNGRDVYVIKKDKDSGKYGIYDKRIKDFVLGTSGFPIFDSKKDSPALINEMEARIESDNFNLGDITDLSLDEQVGMILIKLESDGGIIPKGKEDRVRKLLKSYFEMRNTGATVTFIKNAGYLTAMGTVSSAITQIADFGGALFRSIEGQYTNPMNYARFTKSVLKAFIRKSDINLKTLGIDDNILQELGQGSVLNKVFYFTGLRYMDRVGKESYVNSVILRYKKEAKRFLKNKKSIKDAKFQARIEEKFKGQERNQVIKDLADGKNTEIVQLLAYSELLDIQPVAKSEVPIRYLEMENGRVFYMLKTFMIKRIDFFGKERQMVFKQAKVLEKQGKIRQAKALRMSKGYIPLISLAIILTLAESGADTLKDALFGRKTTLNDLIISNILKLALLSRYTFYNILHDPQYAVVKMILPPMDWATDPLRDAGYFLTRSIKNEGDFKKSMEELKKRGYRSLKNIPFVGKFLHFKKTNWLTGEKSLGYGQKNIKRREKKKKPRKGYSRY